VKLAPQLNLALDSNRCTYKNQFPNFQLRTFKLRSFAIYSLSSVIGKSRLIRNTHITRGTRVRDVHIINILLSALYQHFIIQILCFFVFQKRTTTSWFDAEWTPRGHDERCGFGTNGRDRGRRYESSVDDR